MPDLLERLVQLEQDIRYQDPPSQEQPEYRFVPGARLPVLVSAPHGAVHIREGSPKPEDEYTAAMALLLGELTGAHVLYARRRSATDPNADLHAPYKDELSRLAREHAIRFVLDLHGAHHKKGFRLALGTGCGAYCPDHYALIISTLSAHGFDQDHTHDLNRLDVDQLFPAKGTPTREPVARFVWERLSIPAAQIEINGQLRIVRRLAGASEEAPFASRYPQGITNTIHALAAVIEAVAVSP